MRLRNDILTLNLKRKSLPPVLYERIDGNNVRIGTKWFKYAKERVTWDISTQVFSIIKHPNGVKIYYANGTCRFISNSWYDINTNGTYEEFEESFNKWMESL